MNTRRVVSAAVFVISAVLAGSTAIPQPGSLASERVPAPAAALTAARLDKDGHLAPSSGSAGSGTPDSRRRRIEEDREIAELLKGRFVDSVSVEMVMVPAVVEDRRGRPVLDLKVSDFVLLEEGRPQKIDFFAMDRNQPVSIAFLLDVSGSMRMSGRIETAKEAVRYFLNGLRQDDQASLIAFADRQVAVLTEFSTDRVEALKYLHAVRAYGQTALNDAIAAAPGMVDRGHSGRKAIVLITDGVDNFSELSIEAALDTARAVDVPIYCVGFSNQSREVVGRKPVPTPDELVLRRVSEETGGVFFMIYDPDDMKEAVTQIEEDLRSQYVLGYSPARAARDGKFRSISLTAANGHYAVRTRRGYVLPPG